MKISCAILLFLFLLGPFSYSEPGPYQKSRQIIPREAWKAQPEIQSDRPGEALVEQGTISFVTVHQTESANPQLSFDSECKEIRHLQALHQNGKLDDKTGEIINKMGDVAYHFIIAPSGRIYEGRYLNFQANSNTTYLTKNEWLRSRRYSFEESLKNKENFPWGGTKGEPKGGRPGAVGGHLTIAFLGTYTTELPSELARDAFVLLLAQLLKDHQLNIHDVFVHREVASTDCPGEPLYVWLRNPVREFPPGSTLYGIGSGLARVNEMLSK